MVSIGALPLPALLVDLERASISFANQVACRLLGLGSEAHSQSLDAYLEASSALRTLKDELHIAGHLEPGESCTFRAHLKHSGIPAASLEVSLTRLTDGESAEHLAVLVAHSLVNQSQTTSDLGMASQRFHALVDAAFDAYYDWEPQTGRLEYSTQMADLLRLPIAALPHDLTTWRRRIHPEDRQRVLANLRRCLKACSPCRDEYRLKRGDGTYARIQDNGLLLLDDEGSVRHMVGVIRDVTQERDAQQALHDSQALYETLFRRATTPAIRVDEHGLYVDANDAFLACLGVSRDALAGMSIDDHFSSEAVGAIRESSFAKNEPLRVESHVDGPAGRLHLLLTVVPSHLGQESTFFVLAADVTHLLELQQALKDTAATLEDQASLLSDRNAALRVLLDARQQDRAILEREVVMNIEEAVEPFLESLRNRLFGTPEVHYLDAAMVGLDNLRDSFAHVQHRCLGRHLGLTRREQEIAGMIRAGKTTSDIADSLCLSPKTVGFHRTNIRRKLGLRRSGPRLGQYLASQQAPAEEPNLLHPTLREAPAAECEGRSTRQPSEI